MQLMYPLNAMNTFPVIDRELRMRARQGAT
jgi:hypothetical protein